MTEYDHCLLGCACKGWGNEPEVDFGTFDEDRHELVAVEPVSAIPKDLEDRVRQDVHDWYAPRIERIKDLAKEAGIWEKVACALANSGSSEIGEPPEYALRLNMLKAERDAAFKREGELMGQVDEAKARPASGIEEALREAVTQLAECFRLTGADPDGDPDSMIAKFAVEEVTRMRKELDRAEKDHQTALEDLDGVKAELAEARSVLHGTKINYAGTSSELDNERARANRERDRADLAQVEMAKMAARLKELELRE